MVQRILDGEALARFDAKATEIGTETVQNCNRCLNAVTEYVFPQRALPYQRRYMRRYMRKKEVMKTREFNTRLQEINAYLSEFPPFGGDVQRLADDDLAEVLEFAVPASWQKAMVLQGFNAFERSTTEIVEFCERIEFTERLHNDAKGKSSRTDSKSSFTHGKGQGKSSDGANKNNKRNGRGYCPLHDTTSHDISECKVILNQAKKMRDSWQSRSSDERRSFKKRDKEVNAVMKEFAAALKDGRITRKKRKAPNGKTYDVYNVQEDFSQLTMSTNSDSDASSVTSDNSWRLGESLYAFEPDSS